MKLTVFRAGKAVFTEPLCPRASCEPASPGALDVRNVWGDRQAEVVVELYTGSAHCCFKTEVAFEARGAWRSITHDWGNLGYRGQWHDGAYWFVTGDDRFAYAFTDYADSAFPMQVWTIRPGRPLRERDPKRLDLVAGNATRLWKAYLKDRATKGTDVRGVLGAWCADQYLLGKRRGLRGGASEGAEEGPAPHRRPRRHVRAEGRGVHQGAEARPRRVGLREVAGSSAGRATSS